MLGYHACTKMLNMGDLQLNVGYLKKLYEI